MRADALHQRIHRQNDDAACHGWQVIQAGKPRRDDFLVGREAVVWQRFPVRKGSHHLVGKLLDFVTQPQRILHIRGDEHHRAGMAFGNFGAFYGTGRTGELP
ncbi:hypothetical protein D3C76_1468810 [compost metagenome]